MSAYRPKHLIEYAALRAASALIVRLPYRASLAVGWAFAWFFHVVLRFRVAAARSRVRQVLGAALPGPEVDRILWQSWRNIVFSGVDMIRAAGMTLEWMRSVCEPPEPQRSIQEHCRTGRGAIIACPHMGSWELAAVLCRLNGIPIFSVAAPQKNPLTSRYLTRLRARPGIDTVVRGRGTMKEVMRRLAAGGALAILSDVRMAKGGIPIPFLGAEAQIGKGMALFARQMDVPIFPCIVTRRGWTRHCMTVREPVFPDKSLDKETDIRRMTARVLEIFEEAVRADPGQWFWFNKRWVLDPVQGEPPPDSTARRSFSQPDSC